MHIQTINPATEKIIKNYSLLSKNAINDKIEGAADAFLQWRKTPLIERRDLMLSMVSTLEKNTEALAHLAASEMGKPLEAGRQEVNKCAWVCRHYAEHAEAYLQPYNIETEQKKSTVCYQPLGVIFAIMPWNFPFWQVFRFAAPNLMAGNVGILKHAPITTGCGEAIADLFKQAGFPDSVFQHFIIDNEMAANVIAHPYIAGVTLTGSETAGSIVAANAGAHLKKTVLELGGNDAYLVLADAELKKAAEAIVMSRLNNTGQTCIAAKRVIVVKEAVQPFLNHLLTLTTDYVIGDPLDSKTKIGPMARKDLREALHHQVIESVAKGAKLALGGVIPSSQGFYYPVTVLTDVKPGMPAFDDELFGPVLAVIPAEDEKHAITLANQSRFGLGSAVFTQDIKRGQAIAMHEIEAGSCAVNGMVSSDPRLPFGGIKHSGYGRELSKEGFLEFMNIKTVSIHAP